MRSFYPHLVDAVSPVLIHLHSQEGLSLCLAPNSICVLHLHKTNPLLTGQATERPPYALLNAPALSLTLSFVFHFTLFQAIFLVLFSWGKEKGCVFGKRGNVIGSLTNGMAKKSTRDNTSERLWCTTLTLAQWINEWINTMLRPRGPFATLLKVESPAPVPLKSPMTHTQTSDSELWHTHTWFMTHIRAFAIQEFRTLFISNTQRRREREWERK